MDIRLTFKHVMGAAITSLLLATSGSANIAFASQGDTNLDKLIMSSMCKTRVADNSKADTLTNPGQKNHWVCPMHPEVHNHEPGKCPICKMNLVKAKPKST